MQDLKFLFTHLPLLCQHTDEIISYTPYYYSNIKGNDKVTWPLGAYLELWREIHVNDAGKKLLTSDILNPAFFNENEAKHLEEESGFAFKHPMPKIPRQRFSKIIKKSFERFEMRELPLAVPLEQTVRELQEQLPLKQRLSYGYFSLIQQIGEGVTDLTGTSAFASEIRRAYTGEVQVGYDRRKVSSPVFFRVQQNREMNLSFLVELQVRTRFPHGTGLSTIKSGRVARVSENMQNCYNELEEEAMRKGYYKFKVHVSIEHIGISALFEKMLINGLPNKKEVEDLASLLSHSKLILEKYRLWEENERWLEIARDSVI